MVFLFQVTFLPWCWFEWPPWQKNKGIWGFLKNKVQGPSLCSARTGWTTLSALSFRPPQLGLRFCWWNRPPVPCAGFLNLQNQMRSLMHDVHSTEDLKPSRIFDSCFLPLPCSWAFISISGSTSFLSEQNVFLPMVTELVSHRLKLEADSKLEEGLWTWWWQTD